MKLFKVIANVCLVFLAFISALVSIGYVYYHFFVKDYTVGVNYIDNQIGLDVIKSEDLSDEEKNQFEDRVFLQANYYSNAKNNGIALQELNLNYFTDYTLTSDKYRSTGMQFLGDLRQEDLTIMSGTSNEAQKYQSSSFSYYDSVDGISWSGNKLNTQMNRDSKFVVKIDNRPFQVQLTGEYVYSETSGWWIFEHTTEHKVKYTYLNVFVDCMDAIRSNSAGYGDYYIIVDLSEYFTIYEYDSTTGKYKEDDVSDIIKNYSVLKFHYDENGARNSTQSLFKCIDCNPSYDVVDKNINTNYWQERVCYTFDANDFVYRYSDVYNGYFVSLSMDTKTLFANMPRSKVNINIDLESQYLIDNNINIVGIDYNGFENFEIDTLSIHGKEQTFYILEKAMFDTKLQTLKRSNNIKLEIATNSINSEYVEVIL